MKYIFFFLLLLAGCVSQPQHPLANNVRAITPGVASTSSCRFLGPSSAFGAPIEGGARAAQQRLRNRVATMGGNAYVLTSSAPDQYGGADITADAYACPQ